MQTSFFFLVSVVEEFGVNKEKKSKMWDSYWFRSHLVVLDIEKNVALPVSLMKGLASLPSLDFLEG